MGATDRRRCYSKNNFELLQTDFVDNIVNNIEAFRAATVVILTPHYKIKGWTSPKFATNV